VRSAWAKFRELARVRSRGSSLKVKGKCIKLVCGGLSVILCGREMWPSFRSEDMQRLLRVKRLIVR